MRNAGSERIILHADCNGFFASCHESENPWYRSVPAVVGGDEEARRGIVLAKNELAKKHGIKTAISLMEARRLCPKLVTIPPNQALYTRFSHEVLDLFEDYTGKIQRYGIDEAWLDLGASSYEEGKRIADELRARAKDELGITLSVGVSYNAVFAKIGSDYVKPDATTVITRDNFRELVWPLPAGDLLFVGGATQRKLARIGVKTIGDIAGAGERELKALLGVHGPTILRYADGTDASPIFSFGGPAKALSVGHSNTFPRDLSSEHDVRIGFFTVAEGVTKRLRKNGLRARTLHIWVRDQKLQSVQRQMTLKRPTMLTSELTDCAMELFRQSYDIGRQLPIRALGLSCTGFTYPDTPLQLSFFPEETARYRRESLERALDAIRGRYGHFAIQIASLIEDPIGRMNPSVNHVAYPAGFRIMDGEYSGGTEGKRIGA